MTQTWYRHGDAWIPERSLEPPDCLGEESGGEDDDDFSPFDEYDRAEDEMNGRTGLRPKH